MLICRDTRWDCTDAIASMTTHCSYFQSVGWRYMLAKMSLSNSSAKLNCKLKFPMSAVRQSREAAMTLWAVLTVSLFVHFFQGSRSVLSAAPCRKCVLEGVLQLLGLVHESEDYLQKLQELVCCALQLFAANAVVSRIWVILWKHESAKVIKCKSARETTLTLAITLSPNISPVPNPKPYHISEKCYKYHGRHWTGCRV